MPSYNFGEFELDGARFELRRNGRVLKVERIPLELLILLAERNGNIVSRQEIIDRLWGKGVFVDTEHGINTAIRKIRSVLRDDAERPRFVQTIQGKGYRFLAESNNGNTRPIEASLEAKNPAPVEAAPAKNRNWWPVAIAILGICLLAGTLLGFNAGGIRDRIFPGTQRSQIQSLAVLPLANFSGDPNQEYFVDGMTDKLITNLAQLSSLRVVSRTSIMQYKDNRKPLRQIARELQVDAVVEGSVVRSGDQVRITAQLIDTRDDRHLWAQSYDRNLRDILQLQGEVAGDIAQKISSNLLSGHSQPASSAARPLNLAAYDDYLKGRYYSQRLTNADLIKGIGYLERSIQQEPNYAPAYTDLAIAYAGLGSWFGWFPPGKAYPKAKAAALRALALDPDLAEAHAVLGWLYEDWEWNWAGAGKEVQRAVQLNPNSSFAHSRYAVYLVTTGQSADAESETKRTLELDPLSPLHRSTAAYVFICLRQYDRAIQEARRAVEIDPAFADAHVNLAEALGGKGLYREGFSEWLQYLNLSGDAELAQQLTMAAEEASGSGDPGRKLGHITLRYFQQKSRTRYVAPLFIAGAYLDLGDKDHALEWLDTAYQERSSVLFTIKVDPSWDPLRSDPRFDKLIRKIGFPN